MMPFRKAREPSGQTAAFRRQRARTNYRLRLILSPRLLRGPGVRGWLPKLQNPRRNQYWPKYSISYRSTVRNQNITVFSPPFRRTDRRILYLYIFIHARGPPGDSLTMYAFMAMRLCLHSGFELSFRLAAHIFFGYVMPFVVELFTSCQTNFHLDHGVFKIN